MEKIAIEGKKTNEQMKEIYKRFFKDFSITLLFSSTITIGVFLIYLICVGIFSGNGLGGLMGGFFGQILVITLIAMAIGLITPFIYSYFACNGALSTSRRDDVRYMSFIKTYLIGNRPPFQGQLRIWDTLLKAFLIFFGVSFISTLILYFVASGSNSAFAPLLEELSLIDSNSANYLGEVEKILFKYKDLLRTTSMITGFFGVIISTYYFIHTIGKQTIKFYMAPVLIGAPPRLVSIVYRLSMKKFKKEYLKGYYKVLSPITALFVISFTLSYFLIGYLGPIDIDLTLLSLTAMSISIIVILPFFPLLLNYHQYIWPKFSKIVMEVFITNIDRELKVALTDEKNSDPKAQAALKQAENNINVIKDLLSKESKQLESEVNNEIKNSEENPSLDNKEIDSNKTNEEVDDKRDTNE